MIGIVVIAAIVIAIFIFVLRKKDPNHGEFQVQCQGNDEEKTEEADLNQIDSVSATDTQEIRPSGTLSDSGHKLSHENQEDSFGPKKSQLPSTSPDDNNQHHIESQKKNDSGDQSLKFKTFGELSQYWNGQENNDSSSMAKPSGKLPNSGYLQAQGGQKQSKHSRSTRTRQVKSSPPRENNTLSNSDSSFYPLDPAIYVLGKPNIQNHRRKRYARRRSTFWR